MKIFSGIYKLSRISISCITFSDTSTGTSRNQKKKMNCSQIFKNLLNENGYNLTDLKSMMVQLGFAKTCESFNGSFPYTELLATFRISNLLLLYISPILFFGILGNLLSFIVLQRQRKKVSTYFYLCFLSVMDFAVLLTGLAGIWGKHLIGKDVQDTSDLTCKFSIFFGHFFSDVSVWVIIAVTVERFVVVKYPFRTLASKRIRQAKIICAAIVALMCAINVHFLVLAEIHARNGAPKCEIRPSSWTMINNIWPWIDAVVYSFLPFTILVVLNGFIIRSVCKSKDRRKKLMSLPRRSTKSHLVSRLSKENRKTTMMLFSVSCTFLVTALPMNVATILNTFWNNSTDKSMKEFSVLYLLYSIAKMLMYMNHSINFVLYCALGTNFRKALYRIVTPKCRRNNDNYHTKRLSSHTMTSHEVARIQRVVCKVNNTRWL